MKKTYRVMVDVLMSGCFYIEADSPTEADRIILEKTITPSDLRNFCHVNTEVIEETTECLE